MPDTITNIEDILERNTDKVPTFTNHTFNKIRQTNETIKIENR